MAYAGARGNCRRRKVCFDGNVCVKDILGIRISSSITRELSSIGFTDIRRWPVPRQRLNGTLLKVVGSYHCAIYTFLTRIQSKYIEQEDKGDI